MCMKRCLFCTWRFTCVVIAFGGLALSLVGPIITILFAVDKQPELKKYQKEEPEYFTFLWFLIGFCWFMFFTSIVLLVACVLRSRLMLKIYIWMGVLHLPVTLAFALRYLIYCTAYDKKCMDHSSNRTDDDVNLAIGVMILDLSYIGVWLVILFIVASFRTVFE